MNNLPKRKQIRIEDYDYATPGAYFITVCIQDRKPILWNVGAATCRPNNTSLNVGAATCRPNLSKIGSVVETAILQIPEHYTAVSVDKYCVMPDHIHMILSINTDEDGRQIAAPTVSTVVGHMKRWVSMQLGQSIWQKSFIDRIIRNDKGYRAVWEYIENNPIKLDTAYDMPDFDNM
ncbi:MAG: transposase [Oscillospiraceae bacterium]|nr:transposase [Oscillospiraceae bacterium]